MKNINEEMDGVTAGGRIEIRTIDPKKTDRDG